MTEGVTEEGNQESGTRRGSRDTRRDSRRTSQHRQARQLTRGVRSSYTAEETERGLRHIAVCSGNVMRAQRELAEQGLEIPYETMRSWVRRDHVERYLQIEQEELPKIHARMARRSEELALQAGELEAALIKRLEEKLPDVPPRDLSRAVRDVATSRKVSVEKSVTLRGGDRPRELNPIKDFTEALKDLQRLGLIPKEEPKRVTKLDNLLEEEDSS
jgi:hypothetical protein